MLAASGWTMEFETFHFYKTDALCKVSNDYEKWCTSKAHLRSVVLALELSSPQSFTFYVKFTTQEMHTPAAVHTCIYF